MADLYQAYVEQKEIVEAYFRNVWTFLKHEDTDTLEAGVKSGLLKTGTRLSITYTKGDAGSTASEIKLRDFTKK